MLGRIAFGVNIIYGVYGVFSGVSRGDYSKAAFSALGSIYSGIATYGGVPGMILAGPMVLVDSTIGLDNFWQFGVDTQAERAARISRGDYSMIFLTPGRTNR